MASSKPSRHHPPAVDHPAGVDAVAAWVPPVVYVLAVVALLGPSLVGSQVVLPHDLLLTHPPWSEVQARPTSAANPELRDVIDQYYPAQRELWSRLRAGEDATWLRDVSLGMPGVQFVGWGALSPFNWPALVLPFDTAWSWGMALRLLTAMGGAHLLARSFGIGRVGATVAGLSFGLSGFMVMWLGWPQSHVGAWIPWVCWAARRTAGADPPWWGAPVLALVTAALWLGGFPAVALYTLVAAGIVALHAAWERRGEGRAPPLRGLAVAALGVALGTALVAFTLWPSMQFLEQVDLAGRAGAWRPRVPPFALYTFVVPAFFGDVVSSPGWLPGAHVESIGYAGVVTLVLAIPAWLLHPRRRGLVLWSGLAVAFALHAYGLPPLRVLISYLPLFSTNPPTRVLALVGLGIAMLGAFGADALARAVRGQVAVSRGAAVTAAIAAAAGLAAYLASRPVRTLREFALERITDPAIMTIAPRTAVVQTVGAAALVLAAAGVTAIALWLARREAGGRERRLGAGGGGPLLGAGLVAIVAVDLVVFAAGWNVQVDRARLFPGAPGITELTEQAPGHRVAGTDEVAMPNTHLVYGFADLRAHAFLTARQREVLRDADAHFHSFTRWDLRAQRSAQWEPWLSALAVGAVLSPAEVRTLPNRLQIDPDEVPMGPLAPGARLSTTTEAQNAGTLTGVQLRLGTYGQRPSGQLEVVVTGPDATVLTTGTLDLAGVADNAITTAPVDPVNVDAGAALGVELVAHLPSDDVRLAVHGSFDDGPSVALVTADDLPWSSQRLGPVRLFTNPHAIPRVHAVGDVETVPAGEAKAAVEAAGPEALASWAVVDEAPDLPPVPSGGSAEVRAWAADAGTIAATVTSDRGALLVAAEAPFDGWRATVNGAPAPVLVANHVAIGVAVPPGSHEVVLRHRSPGLVPGVATSLLAALALGAFAVAARRRTPVTARDSDAATPG